MLSALSLPSGHYWASSFRPPVMQPTELPIPKHVEAGHDYVVIIAKKQGDRQMKTRRIHTVKSSSVSVSLKVDRQSEPKVQLASWNLEVSMI